MANSPNPDRDTRYMMDTWGTNRLTTDYGEIKMEEKMLREIEAMDNQIKKEIDDGIIQSPMAQVSEEKK
jgi:hypothetical protein